MTTPPRAYSASLTRIITGATTEIVPDTGLDHPCGLSVHYTGHARPREEDSVKSEERELEQRRKERLRREERLVEAEAEAEAEVEAKGE